MQEYLLPLSRLLFVVFKMSSVFASAAYIQVHYICRLNVRIEANNMSPDQTAPFRAVWSGPISFAIWVTLNNISR